MATWTTGRASLKTTIEAVTGIGYVYNSLRDEKTLNRQVDRFVTTDGVILVTFVHKFSEAYRVGAGTHQDYSTADLRVITWMTFNDESDSQTTFDDLMETMLVEIAKNQNLGMTNSVRKRLTLVSNDLDYKLRALVHIGEIQVLQEVDVSLL